MYKVFRSIALAVKKRAVLTGDGRHVIIRAQPGEQKREDDVV
jgi:hypothetical protein